MGWTHYWRRPTELEEKQFLAAGEDCRKVCLASKVPLAGFGGTGEMVCDGEKIEFSGAEASCEPFSIGRIQFDRLGRTHVTGFCKTEKLPYDTCVMAVLIVLAHHFEGVIEVDSDGTDKDWEEARHLVQDTLGYGNTFVVGANQ